MAIGVAPVTLANTENKASLASVHSAPKVILASVHPTLKDILASVHPTLKVILSSVYSTPRAIFASAHPASKDVLTSSHLYPDAIHPAPDAILASVAHPIPRTHPIPKSVHARAHPVPKGILARDHPTHKDVLTSSRPAPSVIPTGARPSSNALLTGAHPVMVIRPEGHHASNSILGFGATRITIYYTATATLTDSYVAVSCAVSSGNNSKATLGIILDLILANAAHIGSPPKTVLRLRVVPELKDTPPKAALTITHPEGVHAATMVATAVSLKEESHAPPGRGVIIGPRVTPPMAGILAIAPTEAILSVFVEFRATLPDAAPTIALPKVPLILWFFVRATVPKAPIITHPTIVPTTSLVAHLELRATLPEAAPTIKVPLIL